MARPSRRPSPPGPASLILNVDDTEAGRYAISRVLSQAGFRVVEATTGEEAVAVARAADPALIVLDVNLPDISGLEVCSRLRADPRTAAVPVLHLTATYANSEGWAAALDQGADAYLTEPVDPAVLVATVRALLRARAAEAEVRREAERWQTTFDTISHGVAYLDADGTVLRANRAMAEMHGVRPSDLVGKRPLPPIPGAREPAEGWPLQRARHSLRREVSHIQRGDRWFEVAVDPVTRDGAFRGAVRTVTDITESTRAEIERKRAEAERDQLLERERAARLEAEAANRLKDEFLATLSHELRTPLNAIVGWAAVLRGQTVDPELRRAVDTIDRNARAQSQLIEDILDVSRIVTGKLTLEVEPVDLVTVVGAALESLRPSAEAKRIHLHVDVEADLPELAGDPGRLQQVVWNLLSNGVKFTPAGGTVAISARVVGPEVRLEVRDTGAGIAPDFLPHVFERFRQADASTTRAHGGLGLGLAIVHHLVELHGGTVEAESPGLGGGATFRVRLPVRRQPPAFAPGAATQERAVAAEPSPPPTAAPLDGLRVLVVDDDLDTLTLLVTVLRASGAEALPATSAQSALETFMAATPDVLVSDIGLPGEDGFSLLAAIRGLPAEAGGRVAAIALTAYARAEDRDQALRTGFDVHMPKPLDPQQLVTAIAGLRREARPGGSSPSAGRG
jgi:PAS domain S-box-containing protein